MRGQDNLNRVGVSFGSLALDPYAQGMTRFARTIPESPDMKNIYDGVTALDGNGEAIVAVNRDFRYQLTLISLFAPGYIAGEIQV